MPEPRELMYIYLIKNTENGSCYVGQTIVPRKRKNRHFYCLRHNNHVNPHLQNAFNRYGESKFVYEIIDETEELFADAVEDSYISYYKSLNKCYNIDRYYKGTRRGCSNKESTNKKISEALKGRKLSKEHCAKLKISRGKQKTTNKMKEALLSFSMSKAIKVAKLDSTGKVLCVYDSIRQTSKDGYDPNLVRRCIHGRGKTHGGFIWKRADNL